MGKVHDFFIPRNYIWKKKINRKEYLMKIKKI